MDIIIIGLAGLFFAGHFLQWLFVKTKIPDLLLLILAGMALGPSGIGALKLEDLGKAGEALSLVTLIIILYEGGLNLSWRRLASAGPKALLLSLLSFFLTAGLAALALSPFVSLPAALLVGAGIGSTSSAIVFPLVQPLGVQKETKTILGLESAFTDVLAIIAFLAVLEMAASQTFSMSSLIFGFGAKPFLSVGFGAAGGLLWAVLKKIAPRIVSMTFAAEAYALLNYGALGLFQLNGPIGILALGFTLANLNLTPKPLRPFMNVNPVTEKEALLLTEISFLLRAFFFLYLGVIMKLSDMTALFYALFLTALVFASRYAAVRLALLGPAAAKKRPPAAPPNGAQKGRQTGAPPFLDALIAFGMGPRGLACAVLATMPLQKGLPEGLWIQNVIFYVVLATIIITSLFVIFSPMQFFQSLFRPLFLGTDSDPGQETPDDSLDSSDKK